MSGVFIAWVEFQTDKARCLGRTWGMCEFIGHVNYLVRRQMGATWQEEKLKKVVPCFWGVSI